VVRTSGAALIPLGKLEDERHMSPS